MLSYRVSAADFEVDSQVCRQNGLLDQLDEALVLTPADIAEYVES
jgi:hypothetical protein